MLIQFTVSNFLSIKESATLNMLAVKPIKEFEDENVFDVDRYSLLKSSVIYGANASGKSNILKAMGFFKWFAVNSAKETQVDENIGVTPFRLSTETESLPSSFEASFLVDGVKYRYGFDVDDESVKTEWLLFSTKIKEYPLFIRDGQLIEVFKEFKEGKGIEDKTRKNALFLSVVAQFNGERSKSIIRWFNEFNMISGLADRHFESFTASLLEDERYKKLIMNLMFDADLGFKDINVLDVEITSESLPRSMPDELKSVLLKEAKGKRGYDIETFHEKFDIEGNVESLVRFDFDDEESEGTKKYFRLAGPILDTLEDGGVIIIDELDARLHPSLTKSIVQLFNTPKVNRKNAQLIFATHDTNLLSACMFRRDQIWFTEKRRDASTDLYSLAEYKLERGKVRKDASFEKDYIKGRYGAIPYVGDFENLLSSSLWQE